MFANFNKSARLCNFKHSSTELNQTKGPKNTQRSKATLRRHYFLCASSGLSHLELFLFFYFVLLKPVVSVEQSILFFVSDSLKGCEFQLLFEIDIFSPPQKPTQTKHSLVSFQYTTSKILRIYTKNCSYLE